MKPFFKKLGDHRGAPRLYFQEAQALAEIGFHAGAHYSIIVRGDGLTLAVHPEGNRAVCRKVVGGRELCVIDINGKAQMAPFVGFTHALVTYKPGAIRITPSMGEAS